MWTDTEFLDLDDPGIVADIDDPAGLPRAWLGGGAMKIPAARGFQDCAGVALALLLVAGIGARRTFSATPYAERLRGSL